MILGQLQRLIIKSLEAAYESRFEKEAALTYLNDAYQAYLFLITNESAISLTQFNEEFIAVRDFFIRKLVDRYPSGYVEVAQKIKQLKTVKY